MGNDDTKEPSSSSSFSPSSSSSLSADSGFDLNLNKINNPADLVYQEYEQYKAAFELTRKSLVEKVRAAKQLAETARAEYNALSLRLKGYEDRYAAAKKAFEDASSRVTTIQTRVTHMREQHTITVAERGQQKTRLGDAERRLAESTALLTTLTQRLADIAENVRLYSHAREDAQRAEEQERDVYERNGGECAAAVAECRRVVDVFGQGQGRGRDRDRVGEGQCCTI